MDRQRDGSSDPLSSDRSARRRAASSHGMTLPELLSALAIASIVSTFSVMAFDRVAARSRLATSANRLLGAMISARLTAISRNVSVTFCAGNTRSGCHGDWNAGEWIAFVDRNHDGLVDSGEQVWLVDRLATAEVLELSGNGPFRRAVVFKPSGEAQTVTGAFAAGRLRVCTTRPINPNATDLVLIGSGRAESEPHDFGGSCPSAGS